MAVLVVVQSRCLKLPVASIQLEPMESSAYRHMQHPSSQYLLQRTLVIRVYPQQLLLLPSVLHFLYSPLTAATIPIHLLQGFFSASKNISVSSNTILSTPTVANVPNSMIYHIGLISGIVTASIIALCAYLL